MKKSSPHVWPAEWEPQAATWIAWPHNRHTWPVNFDRIPSAFVNFIGALAKVQPVHVLSGPAGVQPAATDLLHDVPNIHVHSVATNDSWIRDYGPTFVRRRDDGSLVGIDWRYNAWGGKYPPYDLDAQASESICRTLGCPRSMSALHCEGGGLETDGQGTLLTTSSCLLSPNRNPGWTREMIATELRRQLGVQHILWVDGGGLQGDDTDGHIDQLARFVAPGVVVAATSSYRDDPNRSGLEKNLRQLEQAQDAQGNPLTVHPLPTPPPRTIGGQRVPESYCNFLLANGIVLVPTFGHPASDEYAMDLFARLYPQRSIVPVASQELIGGLGALHCLSQQQPATNQPPHLL
jgi:agmatine deiminase